MKNKMPLLIASAIAAVGLIGGTVTAFALVNTQSGSASQEVAVEDAIYLKWGANQNVVAVTDLSTAQVRKVVVGTPSASITAGYIHFSLKLDVDTGDNATIAGLSVEIAKSDFGSSTPTILATLNSDNLRYDEYLAVNGFEGQDYYVRFKLNEAALIAERTAQHNDNLDISAALNANLEYSADIPSA